MKERNNDMGIVLACKGRDKLLLFFGKFCDRQLL